MNTTYVQPGNRTIIIVEPGQGGTIQVKLDVAPLRVTDDADPEMFGCDPDNMPPWTTVAAVRQHGQKIRAALDKHKAIKTVLDSILMVPDGEVRPICFYFRIPVAERIYWETLCDQNGNFLALDPRWPIARMSHPENDRTVSDYDFMPPLKIMAFMSALWKSARPEWEVLKKSVLGALKKGLAIELAVFVGEEALLQQINKDIKGGLAGVRACPVPDSSSDVEKAVDEFNPHLLHFFCHGSNPGGVGQLELATIIDWDSANKRDTGSLILRVDDLKKIPALKGTWLVTLNCCLSASSSEQLHSVAQKLTASCVPAAIGTLEPIDAADANRFCQAFYPEVFDRVLSIVKSNQRTQLHWPELLRFPRMQLRDKYGNNPVEHRQWALPVMYIQREPFFLKIRPPIEPKVKDRIEMVASILRSLRPDTPEEAREDILRMLDGVPAELRPDRFGNFNVEGA